MAGMQVLLNVVISFVSANQAGWGFFMGYLYIFVFVFLLGFLGVMFIYFLLCFSFSFSFLGEGGLFVCFT